MNQPVPFVPDLPKQGDLVEVPLLDGETGDTWSALTISTGTTEPRTAPFTMQSAAIPYAELRMIGLTVEVLTSGPYFMGFVSLDSLLLDGTIQLIYGRQVRPIPQSAGGGVEQFSANTNERETVTGYRRFNVLQLRSNPEMHRMQRVNLTGKIVNVRDNVGAHPFNGLPTKIMVAVSARCEVLRDYLVEDRVIGGFLRALPGDGGSPEKFSRLLADAAQGRRLRKMLEQKRR